MFKSKIYLILLTFNIVLGCSTDDPSSQQAIVASRTSVVCPDINGITGVHWDILHGVINTGLTEIPTVQNLGGFFAHSDFPGLGFSFPVGYSATQIDPGQSNLVGVNVIRDDNRVIWRNILGVTLQGNVLSSDLIESEINGLFDFLGVTGGNSTVICSEENFGDNGIGILSFSSRLIEFDGFRAEVTLRSQFVPDLNASFVSAFLTSSPIEEAENSIQELYLPIYFQLLVIDEDVRDSDLDGTPDNQDNFPFDSTRQ